MDHLKEHSIENFKRNLDWMNFNKRRKVSGFFSYSDYLMYDAILGFTLKLRFHVNLPFSFLPGKTLLRLKLNKTY